MQTQQPINADDQWRIEVAYKLTFSDLYQRYANRPLLKKDYSNVSDVVSYEQEHETQNKLIAWIVDNIEPGEMYNLLHYEQNMRSERPMGHAMQCGTPNAFIYNDENHAFYQRFSDEIWDIFYQKAEISANTRPKTTMQIIMEIPTMRDCVCPWEFETLLVWEAVLVIIHRLVAIK